MEASYAQPEIVQEEEEEEETRSQTHKKYAGQGYSVHVMACSPIIITEPFLNELFCLFIDLFVAVQHVVSLDSFQGSAIVISHVCILTQSSQVLLPPPHLQPCCAVAPHSGQFLNRPLN